MRILISGASGTGKTTLSKFISQEYGIPFINTSAKELWPRYGITSHNQLINRCHIDPHFAISFQFELLELRTSKLEGLNSYVSDRGPMDNLVYFLTQVSHNTDSYTTARYIQQCNESQLKLCDQQILLLYGKLPALEGFIDTNQLDLSLKVENDGNRVNNVFYQKYIESIFKYVWQSELINLKHSNVFPTDVWGFEQRQMIIRQWLSGVTK